MCLRCLELSRRSLLVGGGIAAASVTTGVAQARVRPQDMAPLVGPGFRPTDKDEQGIWGLMDRAEEEISGSNLLVNDPQLTGYLKDIITKVGGPAAADFRIYLAHVPEFNAMMFPSGFAVIFTGLLLRMRNEAQLAGVIAHEAGHFLRRHMIRSWRDQRRKTDLFAFGAMAAGVGGAAGGVYMGDYVQLAQLGTILSLFAYSRGMEAEADAMGVKILAEQGYPPTEMASVWQQLIGEEIASARYRRKHRRRGSLFDTHPSPDSRFADLKVSAAEVTVPGRMYDNGRARYLTAIGGIRPKMLDDQVKLNDPGASSYLIQTLAQDGWNGLLRFYEGEIWRLRNRSGDEARAAQSYAAAVLYPDAPADAFRWHGIALMKAGRTGEAKAAFARYLAMKPDAPDAAWVRQMVG